MAALAAASLPGLLPELLTLIVEDLSPQDLSALRLVGNHGLASFSLDCYPAVTTASVMLSHSRSLEVGLELVRNVRAASNLQTLYLNTERFVPGTLDHDPSDDPDQPRPEGVSYIGSKQAEIWRQPYREFLAKQERHRREQLDVRILSQILFRLKTLNNRVEIVLTSSAHCHEHWPCYPDHDEDEDGDDTGCKTCFASSEAANTCHQCSKLRPWQYRNITERLGQPLTYFHNPWECEHDPDSDEGNPILTLFRALAVSGYQPCGIMAVTRRWGIGLTNFLPPAPLHESLAQAFGGLQRLSLRFGDSSWESDDEKPHNMLPGRVAGLAALTTFLAHSVPNLEVLVISHYDLDEYLADRGVQHAVFKACLGATNTYAKLREVSLVRSAFYVDDLISFARRHASTLRKIDMKVCVLLDDGTYIWAYEPIPDEEPEPFEESTVEALQQISKAMNLPQLELTAQGDEDGDM